MRESTRLSVVVPVYNARRTVELCVGALLRQERAADAIYVVDNGSADGTYEWLLTRAKQEPRLHILQEHTRGQAAARNAALRVIDEGIVAFTDADCIPDPHWLANLESAYSDPSIAAVAGSVVGHQPSTLIERYLSIIGFSLPERASVLHERAPLVGFPTANLSVRIDAIRSVGGFDEEMATGEDYDLCLRILAAKGSIGYAPHARVGHIYRSTLGSMLKRMFQYGAARPCLIRKHFGGIAYAVAGRHTMRLRGPVTACVNLTSPEKVSFALILLSLLSPWFLGVLAAYWVRLALRLKRAAQRRGVEVRPRGELVLLTGLHLLEFCASDAGSLVASLRYRALCV